MGVYIKGMEMPKSCMNCMFCGFGGARDELDVCQISGTGQPHKPNTIMPDCPLIPVPPHRRLIDADELKEAYCCNCFCDDNPLECVEPCMDMKILLEAPTIIEAEE